MSDSRLHITNGDSAASLIGAAGIGGDILPWRDPMHHGPFPDGLRLDELSDIRAEYLAGDLLNAEQVKKDFKLRNQRLQQALDDNEVTLWFEHDLLDQLQILEILNYFCERAVGTQNLHTMNLSIICIDRFAGVENFRGLGMLNSEQLASLWSTRRQVTSEQLQLAQRGWAAFRASNPATLEHFLQSDTSALPFLRKSLQRHVQEYPWRKDGLTRSERQILTLVASGINKPGKVFVENMHLEDVFYMGDYPTYQIIRYLSTLPDALLGIEADGNFRFPHEFSKSEGNDALSQQELFNQQNLVVTNTGQRVLDGSVNALDLAQRDYWLGGVHIHSASQPLPVWDDAANHLKQQ